MRSIIIALFILVAATISCRKSNDKPPVTPVEQDSLQNWEVVGSMPGKILEDIWFTSRSRGFMVADKFYQTTDGGESWSENPIIYAVNDFYNLFFINTQIGFAQGSSSLAITINGGDTWKIKPLPTSGGMTVFFTGAATGFYGDENGGGLEKTIDTGNSWVTVFSDPGTPQDYYPYFLNADTGFVATGSGSFASTSDGGQTWQIKTENLPANRSDHSYNQLFFLNKYVGFYACPSGLLRTIDGGQSWQRVLYSLDPGHVINVIKFVDANTAYYKGVSGIYKSTDAGQTWTLNCRLGTDHFIGMYFLDTHNGWACTDAGRVLRIQQ